MLIFWRLLFGHLLADFTFQTNFINRWKRSSVWGMLAHCAMHPVVYAALTWPHLREVWVKAGPLQLQGWVCILLVFVVHFVEDQWRVFSIFKYNAPDNTLFFIWDQIIHYAVIFAVIPAGLRDPAGSLLPEAWPVLGCLFVLVTHACTVFVYFIEKDLYGRLYPDMQEKYLGMAERLVLAGVFLLPGNAWVILALGWLSVMHLVRSKRYLDLSWFSFYLGGLTAVVCGLAARFVYYS
jgi:hypothetical protein